MACIGVEFLWKEFFKDPSLFRDHRSNKKDAKSPDFTHKKTAESLWIAYGHNPSWVRKELGKHDQIYGYEEKLEIEKSITSILESIKIAGRKKDLNAGNRIHAEIVHKGLFHKNICINNAIISMYVRLGMQDKAQQVFDELLVRDVVSWTSLMSGFTLQGQPGKAAQCYKQMLEEAIYPDAVTFTCILKAYTSLGSIENGKMIHIMITKQELLRTNIVLGTALVDMYGKCGMIRKAQEVFDALLVRDSISWTALITGYVHEGHFKEALDCFRQLQKEGLSPNAATFACILKACGNLGLVEVGLEIHAEVQKRKLLVKNDVVIGTALVDMYAKCGMLVKAQEVFNELPGHDVVSWNALITGYVDQGLCGEAFKCFRKMLDEGFSPNSVTFTCILKACGSLGLLEKGEEIHDKVQKEGLVGLSIMLDNALVDMYAKCGAFAKARRAFDELPVRGVISWTALITGYAQHGHSDEALDCFRLMKEDGLSPDAVTFCSILKACSMIGSTEKGKEIHAEARNRGLLTTNVVLGNALVDMYAKCGVLAKAQEVFDELPVRDVVGWTSLISGYSQLAHVECVFTLFYRMIAEGIIPNSVTFVVLLTACSHSGLVEEGRTYFDVITTSYCLNPTLEHYNCMVDLFSRAGLFDKAIAMIENIAPSDRLQMLTVVLSACREWANVDLGKWAFESSMELDEKYAFPYVCMGNIYVVAGMQAEADEIKALRIRNGAWKMPRYCWWNHTSKGSFVKPDWQVYPAEPFP